MKLLMLSLILSADCLILFQSAFAQTPINYGDTVSGSISVTGEKDDFTLNGANGEVITVRFANTSGDLSCYVELFNSLDTRIAYSSNGVLNTTLNSTETFKIRIRDNDNTETGDYSLSLQRVNDPVGAVTLNFGQTASGTIDSFAKIVTYEFSANSNDKIYIRFTELTETTGSFELYLQLYDSTGTKLTDSTSGILEVTVATAGNLYLLVADSYRDGAGTYELTLQRTNNPADVKDLDYDAITEDSLGFVTRMNTYRFTAAANEAITICSKVKQVTFGEFSCYLELFDAGGTELANQAQELKYTPSNAATYYLFISDSYRDGTGVYKFILQHGDVACSSTDLQDPEVTLQHPADGEIIESGSTYSITWNSSDNESIASQEIRLSTDSGATYSTIITSGLDENVQSYNWGVPADLTTAKGRIKVIVSDAQGNQGEDANKNDLIVIKTTLSTDAKSISYQYDKLNRLTKTTSSTLSTTTYSYDALGNRLSLKSQEPEYSSSLIITADLNGNGKDEIIVNFGSAYGIWIKYDDGSWSQLHNLNPKAMVAGDIDGDNLDDIVIDFDSAYGIWIKYGNGNWKQLHNISPKFMVMGNIDSDPKKDIIIDFGQVYGSWIYANNSSWSCLHNVSAESIITGDLDNDSKDDIIVDFGSTYGIWIKYSSGNWAQLHNVSPEFMACGNLDADPKKELTVNFGNPYGVWIYSNNSSWSQLHSLSPENIIIADLDADNKGDVIVDFGSAYGIWIKYSSGNWAQLHSVSPESMVSGKLDNDPKDDLVIDFGSAYGIWGYSNNSTWSQIHTLSP